jgi:hypothetical protein
VVSGGLLRFTVGNQKYPRGLGGLDGLSGSNPPPPPRSDG